MCGVHGPVSFLLIFELSRGNFEDAFDDLCRVLQNYRIFIISLFLLLSLVLPYVSVKDRAIPHLYKAPAVKVLPFQSFLQIHLGIFCLY